LFSVLEYCFQSLAQAKRRLTVTRWYSCCYSVDFSAQRSVGALYSVIVQDFLLCTYNCNTHAVFFTVTQTKLPTEHLGLLPSICCRWQKVFQT